MRSVSINREVRTSPTYWFHSLWKCPQKRNCCSVWSRYHFENPSHCFLECELLHIHTDRIQGFSHSFTAIFFRLSDNSHSFWSDILGHCGLMYLWLVLLAMWTSLKKCLSSSRAGTRMITWIHLDSEQSYTGTWWDHTRLNSLLHFFSLHSKWTATQAKAAVHTGPVTIQEVSPWPECHSAVCEY